MSPTAGCVTDVFVRDGTIYAAVRTDESCQGGGLCISTDGGSSWTVKTTADGLLSNFVQSVYADDLLIYAGMVPGFACNTQEVGGLSISHDGGASWIGFEIANGLGSERIFDVAAREGFAYAAGYCFPGALSVVTTRCVGDLTGDFSVGADDLARLLSWWDTNCKSNPEACAADLDGSGVIDSGDLELLLCLWGECAAAP